MNNDIAGISRRMQPRCQQCRDGSPAQPKHPLPRRQVRRYHERVQDQHRHGVAAEAAVVTVRELCARLACTSRWSDSDGTGAEMFCAPAFGGGRGVSHGYGLPSYGHGYEQHERVVSETFPQGGAYSGGWL